MKRICTLLLLLSLLVLPAAHAEAPAEKYMGYDEFVDWARAHYGYTDPSDNLFLDYDPIYIDPVAYWAWINTDHGVKDGERFIIQRAVDRPLVNDYLIYLQKFGYVRHDLNDDGSSLLSSFRLPEPYAATATIPSVINVEYMSSQKMLLVRYNHSYGLVNNVWRSRALTGAVPSLPASVSDGKGGSVTLKRVLTTDEADCLNMPLDHWVYETDSAIWKLYGIFACVSETTYEASTIVDECGWQTASNVLVPLLKLEINSEAFNPERCFLVGRAPDEGVSTHPLLFWGAESTSSAHFTVDMSVRDDNSLWLIFAPSPYTKGVPLRLYMDLSGSEAGSPMETWAYIDFELPSRR